MSRLKSFDRPGRRLGPADPRPPGAPRDRGLTITGTFEFETSSGVYIELQCGSYIFMDADYGRNLDRDGAPAKAFEPSLFVWATVMSRPTEDRAIVDAGLKALAFDSGLPVVWDEPAATYERASDEHGRLAVSTATNRLRIGDKIRLIPGHCDPTVNLYDWYVGSRGSRVEQLWPITARGAVYDASRLSIPKQTCFRRFFAVPAPNFATTETPSKIEGMCFRVAATPLPY